MPYAESENAKIYYEEHGKGAPLLFIQGLNMTVAGCNEFIDKYKPHYRLIIADFRGAGKSSPFPGPVTVKQMAKDYVSILKALGISTTSVAGISMGGHIALQMAIDYPGMISRIITALSLDRTGEHGKKRLDYWMDLRKQGRDREFIEASFLWVFGEDFYADKKRCKEWMDFAVENLPSYPKEAYLAHAAAAREFDISADTGKIQCPVLVVAGKRDLIFSTEDIKEYAGRLKNARLEVLDCAHAMIDGSFEKFIEISLAFLKQ